MGLPGKNTRAHPELAGMSFFLRRSASRVEGCDSFIYQSVVHPSRIATGWLDYGVEQKAPAKFSDGSSLRADALSLRVAGRGTFKQAGTYLHDHPVFEAVRKAYRIFGEFPIDTQKRPEGEKGLRFATQQG